ATLTYGTPTFLSAIFKAADSEQLLSLRALKSGAEKAPDSLFKLVEEKSNARIIEGYGITECSPILSMNRMEKPTKGVGYAFPSVRVKMVHPDTMQDISKDKIGLILVQGPSIFSGYLGADTSDPFYTDEEGKWYITGDLGYIDETGAIQLAGRKKRFIKIAGEMISLPSIETQLIDKWPPTEHGPVIAVEALEIADRKPVVCLFTTIHLVLSEANEQLKASGMGNLSKITHIENIKEIPLLGSGKTDYRALKKQLETTYRPAS
ncbi:AMP-binding protein, partial [bacterium]|nr:AMP-binding protein [bacterium]